MFIFLCMSLFFLLQNSGYPLVPTPPPADYGIQLKKKAAKNVRISVKF